MSKCVLIMIKNNYLQLNKFSIILLLNGKRIKIIVNLLFI